MSAGTWYVDSSRTAVNWGSAVSGGVATVDIFRLVIDAAGHEQRFIWARTGQPVDSIAVTAAQAATTGGAVPAYVAPASPVAPGGSASVGGKTPLLFTAAGTLAVKTYNTRLYNDTGAAKTLSKVRLGVDVAPVGADLIVDVLLNGTTSLFTTGARPRVVAAAVTGFSAPDAVTSLPDGQYLTISIVQVGSSTPGATLSVQVVA